MKNKLKKVLTFLKKAAFNVLRLVFMYICRIFPIQNNKVVFICWSGKKYADNPFYISKALMEKYAKEPVKNVWLVNPDVEVDEGITAVAARSLRAVYELATAKVWVDNTRKGLWVRKRRGQFYIQTWHGSIGLKKVERLAVEKLPPFYSMMAKHDSKMCDLLLSGSGWKSKIFRESFWYDGDILEVGLPRSDVFFCGNEAIIEKVYRHYKLDRQKKIILYAPTFRNDGLLSHYDIQYEQLLSSVADRFGGDWVVLFRLHPRIAEVSDAIQYDPQIINGTKYNDVNELIVASEIVISDYSSCIFDAMEAGKLCFLYANDIDDYNQERGLTFDLYQLPFPLARNNEELGALISRFDPDEYQNRMKAFTDELQIFDDGHASEKVADIVFSHLSF